MSIMDPIGDMLTSIRNANMRRLDKCVLPHSALKARVCDVLKDEGFILDYKIVDDPKHGAKIRALHVYLKYGADKARVIQGIERVSRPGRRIFVGQGEIPRVRDGFGITILSTSKGVLSSRRARALKSGGELMCRVW
jgi:small subunit ribosomal protein S8